MRVPRKQERGLQAPAIFYLTQGDASVLAVHISNAVRKLRDENGLFLGERPNDQRILDASMEVVAAVVSTVTERLTTVRCMAHPWPDKSK